LDRPAVIPAEQRAPRRPLLRRAEARGHALSQRGGELLRRIALCESSEEVGRVLGESIAECVPLREFFWVVQREHRAYAWAGGGAPLGESVLSELPSERRRLIERALAVSALEILDWEQRGADGEVAKLALLTVSIPGVEGRLACFGALANPVALRSSEAEELLRSALQPAVVVLERLALQSSLQAERAHFRMLEGELLAELRAAEQAASVITLAASVAHEIRNPLAAMSFAVGELREKLEPNSSDRELADLVLAEVQRVNRIVRDFLHYAHSSKLRRAPARLDEIAEGVVKLAMEDPAFVGCVHFEWAFADVLPEVSVDADKFRQVVWNLLLNAVQAARREGTIEEKQPTRGRVRLEISREDREGRPGVVTLVDDDGPGIPESERGRVLQPFETSKPDGTGLGLPLVAHVVELHGGTLAIETSPLGGARLAVWLPLLGDYHA